MGYIGYEPGSYHTDVRTTSDAKVTRPQYVIYVRYNYEVLAYYGIIKKYQYSQQTWLCRLGITRQHRNIYIVKAIRITYVACIYIHKNTNIHQDHNSLV